MSCVMAEGSLARRRRAFFALAVSLFSRYCRAPDDVIDCFDNVQSPHDRFVTLIRMTVGFLTHHGDLWNSFLHCDRGAILPNPINFHCLVGLRCYRDEAFRIGSVTVSPHATGSLAHG